MENENENKKLRAAVYLRVSTDEQAKEGYGLVYQEEKIRAFAESQEYILSERHVYREEGYSGTLSAENRPSLKRLMEDAKEKEFDIVLVYKLDRLARKLLIVLEVVQKLTDFDISFRSVTEPFDTSNHFGRYLLANLGGLAELERETIRERTVNGRIAAAKSGRYVCGNPPYGYKYDKKKGNLKISEKEAEWVRKIYDWYVNEKLSADKIANRLNELGVPTPMQSKSSKFKRRDKTFGHWFSATISRILVNETYRGVAHFRKYKVFRSITSLIKEDNLRPKSDWVEIPVPAIISVDTHERSKKQVLENRVNAKRSQKTMYLYNKLIFCGHCGFKLFAGSHPPRKSHNIRHRFYRGANYRHHSEANSRRCEDLCGTYAESRLEPIWDSLYEILSNPSGLKEKLRKYKSREINEKAILEKIHIAKKQLEGIDIKRKKLMELYLDHRSIKSKEYNSYVAVYQVHEKDLRVEIERLKKLLLSEQEVNRREMAIKRLYPKIRSALKEVSYEKKSRIIHLFVKNIVLFRENNYAEVELRFPKKPYILMFSEAINSERGVDGMLLGNSSR